MVASTISTVISYLLLLLLVVHQSQSLVFEEPSALLDEVGGGVGDLVDDGLGHLLHPLGQLELGHRAGIGVDQVGEKGAIFLVAFILNINVCSVSCINIKILI